jgi:hypothetical protein
MRRFLARVTSHSQHSRKNPVLPCGNTGTAPLRRPFRPPLICITSANAQRHAPCGKSDCPRAARARRRNHTSRTLASQEPMARRVEVLAGGAVPVFPHGNTGYSPPKSISTRSAGAIQPSYVPGVVESSGAADRGNRFRFTTKIPARTIEPPTSWPIRMRSPSSGHDSTAVIGA